MTERESLMENSSFLTTTILISARYGTPRAVYNLITRYCLQCVFILIVNSFHFNFSLSFSNYIMCFVICIFLFYSALFLI